MMEKINAYLEKQWEEGGFLFNFRYRQFNMDKGYDLLDFLKKIDVKPLECFDKRFIQLIWSIPIFLEYRMQDYKENDILSQTEIEPMIRLCMEISGEIERIIAAA